RTAQILSAAAGVYTFHHDPGELSAEFIWGRTVRALLKAPPPARYVVGGWNALVAALEGRARQLGVRIETDHRVAPRPAPPAALAPRAVPGAGPARRRLAGVAERQHGLPRPRGQAPWRRPVRSLRPRRGGLVRALQRRRRRHRPRRRGADPGADADPPRRGGR